MPGKTVRYSASARTHVGKVREINQDSVYFLATNEFICGVVADGMGDQTAGKQASQSVIATIESSLKLNQNLFPSWKDEDIAHFLAEMLKTANLNMIDKIPYSGATVTATVVRETSAIIAHVGECRAYLINGRERSCTQLTTDHSFMERLIILDSWEAPDDTPRLILYRALGQAEDINIDFCYRQLEVGDSLLLCSKGLYRPVNDEEIAVIVRGGENLDTVTQKLIDLANERGGEDNISIIVMRIAHEDTFSSTEK